MDSDLVDSLSRRPDSGGRVTEPPFFELLACAVEAVRRAGEHARQNGHRRSEVVSRSAHDVKLALDHECQQVIEKVIHGRYPAHAILGEEGSAGERESDILWIVDPLDGTVNFSHGLPYWCHSVAVRVRGETVAAAVYSPPLDELYTAVVGDAARRNGAVIHVSDVARLGDAVILTGLEKNFDQYAQSLEVARAIASRAQKLRLMGAAALDLCQVACGRADGFYESGLNVWDMAAGDLICRLAGASTRIVAKLSETKLRYLATNGRIEAELMGLLSSYGVWLEGGQGA
ncbi:MAG: inositol monophosphatase [Kiritimatiellae bacterium]|nr:inositol monophosphatase [Kiritimatiellia bacterium]MDW8459121.1 inositol monophosphatase family protein [Verrucomicrobiota bacterium]